MVDIGQHSRLVKMRKRVVVRLVALDLQIHEMMGEILNVLRERLKLPPVIVHDGRKIAVLQMPIHLPPRGLRARRPLTADEGIRRERRDIMEERVISGAARPSKVRLARLAAAYGRQVARRPDVITRSQRFPREPRRSR